MTNEEAQKELLQFLGVTNPFSPKGLHFLACRYNGKQHKELLTEMFRRMDNGSLMELIDEELQKEIKLAFGLETVTNPAIIILAMGRRPVSGKQGWNEAGYSLLKEYPLPADFDSLDAKTQEKVRTYNQLQILQRAVCEKVIEVCTPRPEPEPVVVPEPEPVVVPEPEPVSNVTPITKKKRASKKEVKS